MNEAAPVQTVEEMTHACFEALREVLPHVRATRMDDSEMAIRVAFELDAARAFFSANQRPEERRKLAALELFNALESRERALADIARLEAAGVGSMELQGKRLQVEALTRLAGRWVRVLGVRSTV